MNADALLEAILQNLAALSDPAKRNDTEALYDHAREALRRADDLRVLIAAGRTPPSFADALERCFGTAGEVRS